MIRSLKERKGEAEVVVESEDVHLHLSDLTVNLNSPSLPGAFTGLLAVLASLFFPAKDPTIISGHRGKGIVLFMMWGLALLAC